MVNKFFANKKVDFEKLLNFGFTKNCSEYILNKELIDGQFRLNVQVKSDGSVTTQVVDLLSGEPYTLHLLEGANGAFVGKVKDEYEATLKEISEKCFEKDVFKSEYTLKVLDYARKTFGDEPEYLWEKFTDNAVLRRKDTLKWYAAVLTVAQDRFFAGGTGKVEVIDLRMQPAELELLIDNKKYFPGYHMNKKHWLTIILDGSVPLEEIFERIKVSYTLANK